MDLFLDICQGIGLALAVGALAGAPGQGGWVGNVLFLAAIAGGAALFAVSLSADDYSAWPGLPAGAAVAPVGYSVSRDVAVGARARATGAAGDAEGSGTAISLTIALAALALAALSTLLPPVSLVALAGFAWLALGQRRRSRRKYEGLRVLR